MPFPHFARLVKLLSCLLDFLNDFENLADKIGANPISSSNNNSFGWLINTRPIIAFVVPHQRCLCILVFTRSFRLGNVQQHPYLLISSLSLGKCASSRFSFTVNPVRIRDVILALAVLSQRFSSQMLKRCSHLSRRFRLLKDG